MSGDHWCTLDVGHVGDHDQPAPECAPSNEETAETPEARALSDFAWLRATNGGEKQGYPPIVRRLLAHYDAALARAEAAQQEEKIARRLRVVELNRALAAESRLAAAEALLCRIEKYAREDRASTDKTTRLARVLDETRRFISSAPALVKP